MKWSARPGVAEIKNQFTDRCISVGLRIRCGELSLLEGLIEATREHDQAVNKVLKLIDFGNNPVNQALLDRLDAKLRSLAQEEGAEEAFSSATNSMLELVMEWDYVRECVNEVIRNVKHEMQI